MRKTWFRVRLEGDKFLGCFSVAEGLQPMPAAFAYCYDTAEDAAKAALQLGITPFTVEEAR